MRDQFPHRAANLVLEAFIAHNAAFTEITRRAQKRFLDRDWAAGQRDAVERLDAYDRALDQVEELLTRELGQAAREQPLWSAAKACFAGLMKGRYDTDRAETFYNSVTRRMLLTVGINRDVEFFYLHTRPASAPSGEPAYRTYPRVPDTASLIRTILLEAPLGAHLEDPARDAALVAQEIDLCMWPITGTGGAYAIEVATPLFYRNKEAYVVGRIVAGDRTIPMIIPLAHGESGVRAETVLLHEAEAIILFSFAYSYFFVDVDRYDALIAFLRSIMPRAELAELTTSLGYNRHGKTEFYRDLHRFVHVSRERFIVAPGLEGAVMIAFTLPNFGFVFKVIKDRACFLRSQAGTPKLISRESVRAQYAFVSHRDRAGRMVDTQEFENLRFRRKRFSAALLEEFDAAARGSVAIADEYVILRHLYVQRKVTPLPLYFDGEKDPEALRAVLVDFGYFLKDIAASGVFPGDLFNTWNYGVTHWGRVVLYDYDDVLPMERVRFREKPAAEEDGRENEPDEDRFSAGDEDFFIDEIEQYSGVPGPLKGILKSVHGDLYTLEFWRELTARLRRGEIVDVLPYDRTKQFRNRMLPSPLTS
ncbi:MAG TPA: bifunctional isocitrate dehydrogenase kinase/phosphatase [Bacteroidota bacterium]|nr:bifunctional isocitrate dehydrogenase kinase/phosphatase [Bacteroidota bacterium]